jgi:rhodanese-related sulfurtransferase
MHGNRSRLPQLTLLSGVILVATTLGGDLAAAAQGWDTTKATQGLIVLAGFTVALLGSLLLLARTISRLRAGPRVSVAELKRRLDEQKDLMLLDVRTAANFVGEQGHIPGAHNIPLEELPPRIAELGDDPSRSIVLICRTDRRSVKAAAFLGRRGFDDVHVVQGGMTAWLDNGWPVQDAHPERTEVLSR